jgi:type III restriction enzyme
MSDFSQYTIDYISGVMSLRKPQHDSLEILANILDGYQLNKQIDQKTLAEKIHSLYPIFTDFDRAFPSLTFALATGVGKTRLMGVFITYLYTHFNIKDFLVVAPSLTIYNKLISDLGDEVSEKYVLSSYLHTREEFRRVLNHSRIMTMPPYRVAISKAFREASAFLRICRFQG